MKRFWVTATVLAFALVIGLAAEQHASAARLMQVQGRCGDEAPPDYGFRYDLLQPHWTVGWEGYVSERTVNQVDGILDRLDADQTAQTMILFLPEKQVGNRVNCAVHFLRYMQLGQPEGPHKDNGFVFLFVVEDGAIDVHYGVGLGLPALTAQELTPLNRLAEQTYAETGSLDQALLAVIRAYDELARSNYGPAPTPTRARPTGPPPSTEQPFMVEPALPQDPLGLAVLCCLVCLVSLVVLFLLWLFFRLASLGGGSSLGGPFDGGYGRGGYGGPFDGGFGGGGWGRGGYTGGGWGGSRGSSGGRMRGGSGSGRSGRGN